MLSRLSTSWLRIGAAPTVIIAVALTTAGLDAGRAVADIPDGTRFYVKPQSHYQAALQQVAALRASGDHESADALQQLTTTPQAVWMNSATPEQAEEEVRRTTQDASSKGQLPVLVAYNLPFRDCSQYSAGGATSVQEYKAWINGIAAGIGNRQAAVVLEPDGLGLIPWYTDADGSPEGCRPAGADPDVAGAQRFEMLNYAVDTLKALPNTSVYLDGTHSGWLPVGASAVRLVQAGVQRADGFFLNVSNYELTERELKYGMWVSKCIYYGTTIDPGNFTACGTQYHPANPDDFSTWALTDAWYAQNVDTAANAPSGPDDLAHFVVDTSRNGKGPWTPERSYPDPQTWCNPPGRGLGRAPSTDTGNDLADAFLWIKPPAESDGECRRGLGAGAADPEWGVVDPPPGAWFPEQALDLIRNATPPFSR